MKRFFGSFFGCIGRVVLLLLQVVFVVLLVGVIGYAGWSWWESTGPHIHSIPLRGAGENLIIYGENFGSRVEGSRVYLIHGSTETPVETIEWDDRRVIVRLPEPEGFGEVRVERPDDFTTRSSRPHAYQTRRADMPSQPNGYTVPVQAESPWPTFRRDSRNTGRSPLPAHYNGDLPWAFQTGKGIFSTPVIDKRGIIYVGSADHNFYAINPDGSLNWQYRTGEIIDSAAAIGQDDPATGYPPVTFISGDGKMYHVSTADNVTHPNDRILWTFEAELRPEVSYNRWFEGNVAIGPDGTLYAGNTNFNYYAINPDGTRKWVYETGSNNWSQAAFANDGTIYWGSVDTYVRAVSPLGKELWNKMTLGFIAASAAVGTNGTIYIGSFDSLMYALDPRTGAIKWSYPALDHIYSSAALGQNAEGKTNAIYFGSADGTLYALNTSGQLLWKYDTGDPIRSSPAVGLSETGEEIVYFGCGNGRLYAINARDGSLRWSFDTTPDDPELRDRNDLNSSPALGQTGIYIGGEHGALWYVPYDYCLNADDPRCKTDELPETYSGLLYVTPGGNTQKDFPISLPPSTMVTLRLMVRQNGQTVNARVCNTPLVCPEEALQVSMDPPVPLRVEHSADGRYIYLLPEGFLTPGTAYTLSVSGWYDTAGLRLGNLTLGGERTGQFSNSFTFLVDEAAASLPLSTSEGETSALEWTRLAAPLPPMLPSLNQIGFDYMDWIIGVVDKTPPDASGQGKLLLWAVGGQYNEQGRLVADPDSDFTLPLSGSYLGDSFILSNNDFNMAVTGIPIPFNQFQLRGQLDPDLKVRPGSVAFADTEVLSIPTFGPYMVVAGLANNWYEKLLVSGTFVTRPYPTDGEANRTPQGVTFRELHYQPPSATADGWVEATFNIDPSYPFDQHRPAVVLVDAATLQAVPLDYHGTLAVQSEVFGNVRTVHLPLPRGTALPETLRAYVLMDVFPMHREDLPAGGK